MDFNNSKVEYLIVDTSAFIKNAPLQEIGNKIITESSVVNEIKSKRQLRRLVVLPYDLEIKEPFPEDINFVTDFAKKTGDYLSLSATDIKVIALTYRYEKEKVGIDHLKKVPDIATNIVDSSRRNPEEQPKNLIGFHLPDYSDESENELECSSINKNSCINVQDRIENFESKYCVSKESEGESSCGSDYESVSSDQLSNDLVSLAKKFETLDFDPNELKVECEDISNVIKSDGDIEDEESAASCEDDDDEGWITPQNIKSARKQMDSAVVKEKPAKVACLTMDFAMQNVLMQIGLNVASIDGKVIKQMRTFILRCYACFKTTGVVTKIFCPHCGNKTLKKVAISLNDEGKQQIHINFRKPLTPKGKKFSLPKFQGGKHACNPILFEDQRIPDQRPTKLARTKNNPLNDDYIAGYSPFIMRDVNSRSALLGIRPGKTVKYWMRKNPNEPKRHAK